MSFFEDIAKKDLYKLKNIVICPMCKEDEIEITVSAELSEDGRTLEVHCLCPKCEASFIYTYKIQRIQVNHA